MRHPIPSTTIKSTTNGNDIGSADATANNALSIDALIIGAGFSGTLLLHKLRDELGLNTKLVEASSGLGGTWHNNRYPGARVDCPVPGYELSMDCAWAKWSWREKYPGREELRAYFNHLDKELGLSKDCVFNARVVSADFNETVNDDEEEEEEAASKRGGRRWTVLTDSGLVVRAKYIIPAIGFAASAFAPDWAGLAQFQGDIYHSAAWPDQGVDARGKRVAVIGTGSTGIQIIQEWAKEAAELYVFQRTPNTALPMRQEALPQDAEQRTLAYAAKRREVYAASLKTFGGLPYDYINRDTFDDSPAEREATYERLYNGGGLGFWNGSYRDLMMNKDANRVAYDFWARKTRARIQDDKLKDLLAPLEPLHPFGAKRPSLEQDFYEMFNRPNVHLVDAKQTPIVELATGGIVTNDKRLYEVDIIAIATGFDSVTGGIERLGIKDINGVDLSTRWKTHGVSSYLGMVVSGCPNMFLPYSAHSPSVFSNGPSSIELQAEWITEIIRQMEARKLATVDAKEAVEQEWVNQVSAAAEGTLFVSTKESWYMGGNIPGKRVEPLFFMGGLPNYRAHCLRALENGLADFNVVYA